MDQILEDLEKISKNLAEINERLDKLLVLNCPYVMPLSHNDCMTTPLSKRQP